MFKLVNISSADVGNQTNSVYKSEAVKRNEIFLLCSTFHVLCRFFAFTLSSVPPTSPIHLREFTRKYVKREATDSTQREIYVQTLLEVIVKNWLAFQLRQTLIPHTQTHTHTNPHTHVYHRYSPCLVNARVHSDWKRCLWWLHQVHNILSELDGGGGTTCRLPAVTRNLFEHEFTGK